MQLILTTKTVNGYVANIYYVFEDVGDIRIVIASFFVMERAIPFLARLSAAKLKVRQTSWDLLHALPV